MRTGSSALATTRTDAVEVAAAVRQLYALGRGGTAARESANARKYKRAQIQTRKNTNARKYAMLVARLKRAYATLRASLHTDSGTCNPAGEEARTKLAPTGRAGARRLAEMVGVPVKAEHSGRVGTTVSTFLRETARCSA